MQNNYIYMLYAVGEGTVLRPGVDYDLVPGGARMRRRVLGPIKYMRVNHGINKIGAGLQGPVGGFWRHK